ncbi:MAG: hypothetical protein RLZZ611_1559 [Cyanobacteriota bacterium]|jgi:type III pantothenate kinase
MGRLLLVGNSRWHWGRRLPQGLTCWHEPGPEAAAALLASPSQLPSDLEAWACVGHLPAEVPLPPERRVALAQVPLRDLPPWLGVDRALVGWRAWCRQGHQPVLVADAGTCLSLTRIDGRGHFRGGRLSAGLALQLRSLGLATAQLPALHPGDVPELDPWPLATAAAMEQGCLQACAAAVVQAVADLQPEHGADQGWRLWLTGGDAGRLAPLLRQQGLEPQLAPNLALEALEALAAAPPELS